MTIAPTWTPTRQSTQCVTALTIPGYENFQRCGGQSIAHVTFWAECGHSGTRDLCSQHLVRAEAGLLKCTVHEHRIRVAKVERIGGAA